MKVLDNFPWDTISFYHAFWVNKRKFHYLTVNRQAFISINIDIDYYYITGKKTTNYS